MTAFLAAVSAELDQLRADNLYKVERPITSAQSGEITVETASGPRSVVNLCANNYLGLADDPRLVAAAKRALDDHGLGMASVRFVCGTQDIHRHLEATIADYVGQEDSILYAACFDANGGVFEPLFGEEDAIVSDALNHASIIDGIRLSKARRYRYPNRDLNALADTLKEARAAGARRIVVATDGVFSMDGFIADLASIRAIADRHDALLMVDDCHATGFIGPEGRGTGALHGVKVDILTGTIGKALGGSAGGFVAAAKPVVDLLRQRSRPYLFSNALPPPIVGAAIAAIRIAEAEEERRARLFGHAKRFRAEMTRLGFDLLSGEHPIVPIMLGEARIAQDFAREAFEEGVYVIGFAFPVVPKGRARIRTQMSAALSDADIDRALAAFERVGRRLAII